MSDAAKEFASLKAMHAAAVLLKEGGQPVPLLPAFGFTTGDQAQRMDLLLVPFALAFIAWLPRWKILPMPPPTGTVQVSSLSASQLAVTIGAETAYQPPGGL